VGACWFGGGMFLLLFSCGLLQRFLSDFSLINWAFFFLINRLGQNICPYLKKLSQGHLIPRL
jgi:hypothetical protein